MTLNQVYGIRSPQGYVEGVWCSELEIVVELGNLGSQKQIGSAESF